MVLMTPPPSSETNPSETGGTLQERVVRVIDAIRPAVQQDGGDLELVDISAGGVVSIRLHGACIGCPSASLTLKLAVERNLKEHVPEITTVQEVD